MVNELRYKRKQYTDLVLRFTFPTLIHSEKIKDG